MMNEYNNAGYIYILTNKSFPNYVKIGYADDVNRRVDQLNSSDAVPFPFEIYAVYGVPSRLTDLKLHALIDKLNPSLRARSNYKGKARVREYFELTPEDAYSILDAIAEITDTKQHLCKVTNNVSAPQKFSKNNNSGKQSFSSPKTEVTEICCDYREEIFYSKNGLAQLKLVDKMYVVLPNSLLEPAKSSCTDRILVQREELLAKNQIIIENSVPKLLTEVSFKSPSAAAEFVGGCSLNGWEYWHDSKGISLAHYRKK